MQKYLLTILLFTVIGSSACVRKTRLGNRCYQTGPGDQPWATARPIDRKVQGYINVDGGNELRTIAEHLDALGAICRDSVLISREGRPILIVSPACGGGAMETYVRDPIDYDKLGSAGAVIIFEAKDCPMLVP